MQRCPQLAVLPMLVLWVAGLQAAEPIPLIRAGLGRGVFRGRYLRLSTDNKVPSSPQLAEVEVYEVRTAVRSP